jgi:hypothetical protein
LRASTKQSTLDTDDISFVKDQKLIQHPSVPQSLRSRHPLEMTYIERTVLRLSTRWIEEASKPKERASENQPKPKPKPKIIPGEMPPIDSDGEEDEGGMESLEEALTPPPPTEMIMSTACERLNVAMEKHALTNTSFICCLKEYGTQEKEDDPELADAAEGARWVRRFAMFETKIN